MINIDSEDGSEQTIDSSKSAGNKTRPNKIVCIQPDSIVTISSESENEITVSNIKLCFICILYAVSVNDSLRIFSICLQIHNQNIFTISVASSNEQLDSLNQDGASRDTKLIARTIIHFFIFLLYLNR